MSVGIGDAAAAVGRCMLGGGVICGAASAAAAAYGLYRVYAGPDGLIADPGIAPLTVPVLWYRVGGQPSSDSSSASAACTKFAQNNGYAAVEFLPPNGCQMAETWGAYYAGYFVGFSVQTVEGEAAAGCPASIDPTNPAYNVPAGSPVGPDGKCPSARYNHGPISVANAAAKVAAHPPSNADGWVQPTKDAIDTGGQSVPAGITTTGPGSQTGTPTTTTTTGGSPSETITETKTPTYTYNYAGDTITYSTSITNVTNNITNSTTTTTVTNTPAPTPQDTEDPCTANPDRIGCLKLGSTPTDVVPTKSPNITFSAESVGLPSGCPADQVIAGKAYSFGPICDAATNARPWVIVGAIFSALMLMLAGVRQI